MRVAPYAIQFSEHSSRLSKTLSVTPDVQSHRVGIATATGVGRYWQGGPALPDRWIVL
jgi:hypothetical protein